jgi:FixJ family two-component response regulator
LNEKWQDRQIAVAFGISTRTVERVREQLVKEGLESAFVSAGEEARKNEAHR